MRGVSFPVCKVLLQGIVLGHDGGEEGVLQGHHLGQLLRGQPRHNAGKVAADGLLPRKAGLLPFRGDAHERFAAVIGVGLTQDMAVLLEQAQPRETAGIGWRIARASSDT